jgi:hypothetical protein
VTIATGIIDAGFVNKKSLGLSPETRVRSFFERKDVPMNVNSRLK